MSVTMRVALVATMAASCAATGRETAGNATSPYTPEQVRVVQRSLDERGYPVDLTGIYDRRTRRAVMDFQRSEGIDATGEIDPVTARALGVNPGDVLPVRGEEKQPQDRIQYHAWTDGGG